MSSGSSSPQVDPLFALVTVVCGPVLGPYLLIAGVAAMGSLLALSRMSTLNKREGALFIMRMVFLALVITIPLSIAIGDHVGLSSTLLVMPIAALIGSIGNGWGPLLDAGVKRLQRMISPPPPEPLP